ncbi:hypothetical protein ILUMI_09564 [Ignelater luminosus]|uniref:ornithine decarboxylase n=1 Tax=Ignelater luminosus TaxID=2038154 RepID=A0A8K0D3M6_IGNLU|nr:hypothetical protein ILUMI_09564 [Ignelater luminosus]
MKMNNFHEPIHVLNGHIDLWNTIDDIITNGNEENPFYICDVNDIIQKYRMWKSVMPRVKPHYAVKCNDHPTVLKVLAALGLGFDCASKAEIDKILSLGVDPSRIIYAHTTKPLNHLRHAAKSNVNLMTFDNEMELHKIKNIHPDARTVIRIKYDAKDADCILGLKFGCEPHTEAPHLLHIARSLGINVVGVSFHVGSGCHDPSAFHGAIEAARFVFDFASTLGYDFNLLDIGGGYPGEMDDSINKYGKIINLALEEYFPNKSIKIISEPGTFFVGSAFTLACNVHSSKKVVTQDPVTGKTSTQFMYYINDGVFGSLSCVISYHILKIPKPLKNYSGAKKFPSIIWGPTCDSMDQVLGDILLPELQLGEWLVFADMGAYTLPLCTPFNGFESPSVYSIISHNNWLFLNSRTPFVQEDFAVNESENVLDVIDSEMQAEMHYAFPQTSFVRG